MTSLRDLVLCRDPLGAELLTRLHEHAEAHDGDVSALEEVLAPYWERHDLDVAAKAEATAWVVRELEARSEARRLAAAKLLDLAEREERASARVRAYVLGVMREAGVNRLDGATSQWRRQKNGGKVPVLVDPAAALPMRLQRVKTLITPDLDAIRAALEAGEDVSGCSLGERSERLVLR
jgi:hypothetical protein